MDDPLQELREEVRTALNILAQDFAVRRNVDPEFDADGFFFDIRRLVEARAITLGLISREGPMGGGGADEA